MISSYKSYRPVGLVLLAVVGVILLAGCNDTLRQFIVPIPKPGGDQQPLGNAVILSTNPSGNGSTMHIDVSGDTLAGNQTVGPNPVFLGKAGASAFIINGDGTVSSYIALLPLSSTVSTATPSSATSGIVAGGTSSSGNFFTANSGTNNISLVAGAAVTQIIPVLPSAQPVAIAGNSSNSKIYVVNQGSNNVSVISTTDNTVVKTIPVGAQPIWAVMSTDGVDVFVVNQGDGTVMVIDTTLDMVIPCSGTGCTNASVCAFPLPACAIHVGTSPAPSPNFAFYDPNRQRLYVSNTGENSISVIKADGINLGVTPQIVPSLLKNIQVSGAPTSVAALNDGTKVYAALGNCKAGTNHTNLVLPTPTTGNLATCTGTQLSVIDAAGLQERGTLTIGPGVVSVDVSGDALHAYAVAALNGTVADIRVATNEVLLTFPAPQQNLSCAIPSNCPANAVQTPFMVRVFP
jgi:YVTN family beta-propeller protein